jgi:hypothetical protein
MAKTIEDIWKENNFPTNLKLLLGKVREANVDASYTEVLAFLKSKTPWALAFAGGRPKHFNSVVAKEPGSNYMVDIIVYSRWKIDNYQYILNCIDINSRYAYGVAMTSKDAKTTTAGMLKIFKKMGKVPHTLQMDKGSEFIDKGFKEAVTQAGVKELLYSDVNDVRKQSVVERHNRTLAGLFRRWRENTGKKDWYKHIDSMYKLYNSNHHRTIKTTPDAVWAGKDANKQDITRVTTNLKVGMKVRVVIKKENAYGKADEVSYSPEVHTIKAKDGRKWLLSNGQRVSDTQVIQAQEGDEIKARTTRETTNQQEEHTETQLQRRVARKATNELKNVGAKSKFDQGVKQLKGTRTRARKPVAEKKKPKAPKTFALNYFLHEFKNDILVKWKGQPVSGATRQSKSILKADLGAEQYAEDMAELKNNKTARKAEYDQWKAK